MPKINRIFRSFQHMLLSLGLVYLFLFILKRVNQLFLYRVSDEAVLLEMFQINFTDLFFFGLFLAALFFLLFLCASFFIWLIGRILKWDNLLIHKRTLFVEKLFVALFPTFLLAGSLNKDSFVTATSVISFFAIFSFVFKSSIWEKGFALKKNDNPKGPIE